MFNFNQKGQIALLVTLVILGAILSIGAGLTLVTIKEMKMASNIEESAMALAAAHAGIEYALYRVDKGSDVERLCIDGWTPLDNNSEYCLEIVNGTVDDPETMKSVGRFGAVRRAILFDREEVFYPDQFCTYSHSGSDACSGGDCGCGRCIFPGGIYDKWQSWKANKPLSKRVGQTFQVDITGDVNRITVWAGGAVTGCTCRGACGYGYWKVELRDINSGHPGDNILASSNTVSVISTGCYQRDFDFSIPYQVTKGEKYSFVIKSTYVGGNEIDVSNWEHRIGVKMAEDGPYIPGRAWYSGSDNIWMLNCNGNPCPDSGSDLMFEISIDPFTGGSGEVIGDLEETRP